MSAFSQLAAKAQVLSNHQVKINHFSSPLVKKKTKKQTKKQTAWHISAFFIINLWPNPLPTMNIHNASTGDVPLIFTQCATFKMPYADVTAQGYKWETLSVSTVWVQGMICLLALWCSYEMYIALEMRKMGQILRVYSSLKLYDCNGPMSNALYMKVKDKFH